MERTVEPRPRLLGKLFEVGAREAGRPTLYEVLAVLLWASVFVVGLWIPPRDDHGSPNGPFKQALERAAGGPLCPWKRLSGAPCPGCGLTRGVVLTLHGDLPAAVALNPLAPLVVLWCGLRLAESLGPVLLRRRLENRIPWPVAWKLYGAALALYLGYGVVRIAAWAAGAPFDV